jgi:hypothetical protein
MTRMARPFWRFGGSTRGDVMSFGVSFMGDNIDHIGGHRQALRASKGHYGPAYL